MVSRRPGESAPTGASPGLPILAMTANALAGRPRSRLAAGMNDHVAKPIDKERLVLCLLGHLGRSGAGRAGNGSGRGRTGRGAGDIVGRFGGSLELIVRGCGASFRHAGPLRPARTPARRGRCPGQRRDPAYHQGQRFHCWRQRACRPCQRAGAGPAPRRFGCAAWKLAGIRLDELRTLCDACLLRLQAMFGDVQAESAS